jgi:ParB family chromosome partitioning protein
VTTAAARPDGNPPQNCTATNKDEFMARMVLIHISVLHPHPANLRSSLGDLNDLAASIRAHGILQPLVVQPHPSIDRHYQVIAGHRRLAAAKLACLNEVPVIVRRSAVATLTAIQIMLVENCQREDLNSMDKAEAMGKLRESGMSGRSIAKATGISEAHVSLHLGLLDLDAASKERLRAGELASHDAARLARDLRARRRHVKDGQGERSGWEPLHFTSKHPLASRARTHCNEAGHSVRGRLGKIACGACWEKLIRQDACGELAPEPERPVPLVRGSAEWKARRAKYQCDYRARTDLRQDQP